MHCEPSSISKKLLAIVVVSGSSIYASLDTTVPLERNGIRPAAIEQGVVDVILIGTLMGLAQGRFNVAVVISFSSSKKHISASKT